MNVMPVEILRKLGKTQKDLKETNMKMTNFIGESIEVLDYWDFILLNLQWQEKHPLLCFLWLMQNQDTSLEERLDPLQYVCSFYFASTANVLEQWKGGSSVS